MKKFVFLLISLLLAVFCFAGCNNDNTLSDDENEINISNGKETNSDDENETDAFEKEVKSLFENAVNVLIKYYYNEDPSSVLKEDFENLEVDKSELLTFDSAFSCYKTNLEYEEVKNKYSEYFSGQLLDDFMTAYFYNDDGTLCVSYYNSGPEMSVDYVSVYLDESQDWENDEYTCDIAFSLTTHSPNAVAEEDRTRTTREAAFVTIERSGNEYRISKIDFGEKETLFYPLDPRDWNEA